IYCSSPIAHRRRSDAMSLARAAAARNTRSAAALEQPVVEGSVAGGLSCRFHVVDDAPALHHKLHALKAADVAQRIALDRNNIGKLASDNLAGLIFDAQ